LRIKTPNNLGKVAQRVAVWNLEDSRLERETTTATTTTTASCERKTGEASLWRRSGTPNVELAEREKERKRSEETNLHTMHFTQNLKMKGDPTKCGKG